MLDDNQSESVQSSFRYLAFAPCGRRDRRSWAMGQGKMLSATSPKSSEVNPTFVGNETEQNEMGSLRIVKTWNVHANVISYPVPFLFLSQKQLIGN